MKKSWIVALIMCFAFSMVLAACGSAGDDSGNNANNDQAEDAGEATGEDTDGKTYKLNFSTASVPGDVHTEGLYTFKEKIEELTDGQIEVEIHHSGSLFTQENERKALQRGDLEMAYTDPWSITEFMPEMSMFTAGYIFNDHEHMLNVLNGEIGEELFDKVADETGIRPLGAYFKGNRQLNYRDVGKEIRTPEDLEGVILRMPNAESWLFLGEAMGAKPTPLDYGELYTALNTGTVDAHDNPLVSVESAKFYEVTDYITLTDHVVDNVWPSINEELWQEMGPDLQEKLIQAIDEAGEQVTQMSVESREELIQFFKDEGLTVIEADKEAFKTRVLDAYLNNEEMTKDWDMDLYERVQAAGE